MKIIKITPEKPIKRSIRHGDNFKITLNPNMPSEAKGKGRIFAIRKLDKTE